MADQSVALQVKDPDIASTLASAQTIQGNQTALQAGRTNLEMLNRQNAGQDIQFRSQLIRDAAAHALDADSWDTAMNAAAQKGAPEAAQYVGRYTPLLQQRLFDAYGGTATPGTGSANAGANGTAATATPTDALDRTYQNVPPAQMGEILRQGNVFLRALATVKDQASQDQAAAALRAVGIPDMALRGPYSPLKTVQLWNEVSQRNNYLAGRLTPGTPSPPVKTDMQVVGDVGYDPYNPGRQLTPAKPEKIGTDLGGDIYGVRDPTAPGGFRRIDTSNLNAAGAPVSLAAAAARIQPIENATGNPAAKNPRSSAMGDDQFIKDTWLSTVKTAHPELAKTLNDDQLLALRAVPSFSNEMTIELAKNNAAALTKANVPVTTATIALAHRFGSDGAVKIFDAAPNTPMEQVVSAKVLDANPQLKGQTTGAYVQGLVRQVGNDPVSTGASAGQKFDPAQLPPGTDPNTGIDQKTGRNEGFLLTRPINDRGLIKGLSNYDIDPNAVGYRQKAAVQAALTTYDPTYRSDIYPIIKSTEEAFAKGKQGDQVRFFNNSIQHMTTLQRYATAMQNGDVRAMNALKNTVNTQFGVTAPNTFNGLKDIVGQEIVKSIVPGGGGEGERQEVAKKLSQASSPQQLAAMLDGYKELGGAQLRDLKVQYENGTFHKRNDFDDKLIPESRAELTKVLSGAAGGTPAVPAAPPVPGAKLYQGRWYTRGQNGESVPVPAKQ